MGTQKTPESGWLKRLFFTLLLILVPLPPLVGGLGFAVGAATDPDLNSSSALQKSTLYLRVGEQRAIWVGKIKKYSLTGAGIRARAVPPRLLIKAIKSGAGHLLILKPDGTAEERTVFVNAGTSRSPEPSPLEKSLSRLNDLEVIAVSGAYVLRGEIASWAELVLVSQLSARSAKDVIDETSVGSTLSVEVGRRLRSWIESHRDKVAFSEPERLPDGRWKIAAITSSTAHLEALVRSRAQLLPGVLLEGSTQTAPNPTVHVKVYILELKRNSFHNFGVEWPAKTFQAIQIGRLGLSSALELEATLAHLEGDGSARVLSNPELVVRSPGEAELFAGGEVPIRTHTRYSSAVAWKPYGLTLKLKLEKADFARTRMDITTEVSHLEPGTDSEQLPSVRANRLRTEVDARFGEPLLLSGLLQEGTRENARGLPVLRNLPVLGSLFGSEEYVNERSELVAILLPSKQLPKVSTGGLELTPELRPSAQLLPQGPVPIPRNRVTSEQERELRSSKEFPWNAI